MIHRAIIAAFALALPSCHPILAQLPSNPRQLIELPTAPSLTPAGLALILDFEVGGRDEYNRWPHPEYEGDRYSGVTWGIGYDAHQNAQDTILVDWSAIPHRERLAATQPFYGPAAKYPARAVRDILISWSAATDVFLKVDLSRVDQQCQRAFPGFDRLRPGAKDAVRSLVFNRGVSFAGPSRAEMRDLRDLVRQRDYAGMADCMRRMERVWRGTTIEAGMARRREAEAQLIEKP